MFAPQTKNLVPVGHLYRGESAPDAPGRRKPDGLFASFERFKAAIDGKSRTRSLETTAFFLALHRLDLPALVHDAPALLARFRGTDKTNIVPRSCESLFPGSPISAFMNLPCEKPARGYCFPYVLWLPSKSLRFKLPPCFPPQ